MKIELITRDVAFERYLAGKDLAFAIANANDSMPGYCSAPECKLFMSYAELSTCLQEGDICISIDNLPVERVTDIEIAPGEYQICKLVARNIREAKVEGEALLVMYHDGVIEEYTFNDTLNAWKFKCKNISINLPSTCGN